MTAHEVLLNLLLDAQAFAVNAPYLQKEATVADTHSDADYAAMQRRMEQKAEAMSAAKLNTITAGKPGEQVLHEEQVGTILVRKLPDDPDCLRISIGEPHLVGPGAYVVIRGRTSSAIELLERALAALKVSSIEAAGD